MRKKLNKNKKNNKKNKNKTKTADLFLWLSYEFSNLKSTWLDLWQVRRF